MAKPPIRRRITPSVPLHLRVENSDKSAFELDLRLSFDFNAMALIEEKSGLNMLDGTAFNNPSASVISVLLWAAMQENHPEYEGDEGLAAVRTWLNIGNVASVMESLREAFLAALPEEKAKEIRERSENESEGSAPLDSPK